MGTNTSLDLQIIITEKIDRKFTEDVYPHIRFASTEQWSIWITWISLNSWKTTYNGWELNIYEALCYLYHFSMHIPYLHLFIRHKKCKFFPSSRSTYYTILVPSTQKKNKTIRKLKPKKKKKKGFCTGMLTRKNSISR